MRHSKARLSRAQALLLAGLFVALPSLSSTGRAEEAATPAPPATVVVPTPTPAPVPIAVPAPGAREPADIMVGNRSIVKLRGTLFQNPPRERARVANQRIAAAIEAGGNLDVSVRSETEGRLFLIGGRGMFGLTPGDLDEAEELSLDQAAAAASVRLERAVKEARERRSLPAFLRALGLSAAGTLLFGLVLFGLERLRRLVARMAAEAAHSRLGAMKIPGKAFLEKDRLYRMTTRVALISTRVVDLVVLYVWVTFVLERFAFTRPWGEQLGDWFLQTAAMLGVAALRAVPDLAVVGLIFFATRWLLKLVGMIFTAIEEGRIEVSETLKETTQPTRRIVTVVVWVFALIMAYPYLPGSGSEAFKGVGVMVGLMVSLGSSALIGQLASGFMIMYSRSLRVGDYVRIGDVEGTVIQLGLFATRIQTLKREVVTMPNAVLSGQVSQNYSQAHEQGGLIVGTSITIGYDTPWRQVEGLLLLAAERTAGLRKEPAPWVNQRALTDFYVDYELCACLENASARVPTLTALHASVLDAFNEYGVQITSPNYKADPEAPKVVQPEQWYAAPSRRQPEKGRIGS